MILCDKVKNIENKVVHVARFLRDGTVTMAKPCYFCQKYLRSNGVTSVKYTDWDGQWQKMKIKDCNF